MISLVWPQEGTWRGTGKQFITLTGPRESLHRTKGSHRPQGKHPRFRLNKTVGEVSREREERWGKRGEEERKGGEERRKQERRGEGKKPMGKCLNWGPGWRTQAKDGRGFHWCVWMSLGQSRTGQKKNLWQGPALSHCSFWSPVGRVLNSLFVEMLRQ